MQKITIGKVETIDKLAFPTKFSTSMLSAMWGCELKWFRTYCQGLVGVNSNPDLIAGGLFATACELTRKAYYNEGRSVTSAVALGVEAILEGELTGHTVKTNVRVASTFERYMEDFPLDEGLTPAKLSDGTHAIEYDFDISLGIPHPDWKVEISFTSLLDGLFQESFQGNLVRNFILDEKTTGRVPRLFNTKSTRNPNGIVDIQAVEDSFRMRGQVVGYGYTARTLGVKVDEVIARVVPLLNKHETAFEVRLPISEDMIDWWLQATTNKIYELIAKYQEVQKNPSNLHAIFYPSYSGSCSSYSRLCSFHQGCLDKGKEELMVQGRKQMIQLRTEEGRILVPITEYIAVNKQKYGIRQ